MDDFDNLYENNFEEYGEDEAIEDNRHNEDNPGENDENQNEGEGEKVDVEPKKKRVAIKQFRLNAETLKGPRGLRVVKDYYQDVKLKGKGYEKQDLDEILKRLEHWAHRMYPKFNFDDSLTTIEKLGKKREIKVHLQQIRLDMLPDQVVQNEEVQEEDNNVENMAPIDEFDEILDQQIALSKVTSRTHFNSSQSHSQSYNATSSQLNMSGISAMEHQDLPTSTQIEKPPQTQLTEEMRRKIAENRLKAIEKLKQKQALAEISISSDL